MSIMSPLNMMNIISNIETAKYIKANLSELLTTSTVTI